MATNLTNVLNRTSSIDRKTSVVTVSIETKNNGIKVTSFTRGSNVFMAFISSKYSIGGNPESVRRYGKIVDFKYDFLKKNNRNTRELTILFKDNKTSTTEEVLLSKIYEIIHVGDLPSTPDPETEYSNGSYVNSAYDRGSDKLQTSFELPDISGEDLTEYMTNLADYLSDNNIANAIYFGKATDVLASDTGLSQGEVIIKVIGSSPRMIYLDLFSNINPYPDRYCIVYNGSDKQQVGGSDLSNVSWQKITVANKNLKLSFDSETGSLSLKDGETVLSTVTISTVTG